MRPSYLFAMLLLAPAAAAPALAHEGAHTGCTGTPNWAAVAGAGVTTITVGDQKLYVHPPPHGAPANQDPYLPDPVPHDVGRRPGIIWIEDNEIAGFQKYDYTCIGVDGSARHPLPDMIVL